MTNAKETHPQNKILPKSIAPFLPFFHNFSGPVFSLKSLKLDICRIESESIYLLMIP